MAAINPETLADELMGAYAARQTNLIPPSARQADFDLAAAYAVEAELVRRRRAAGHQTSGRKVGFANKAIWRVLKLDTLVWAHMYDDTVRYAAANTATLPLDHMCAPKIEPEIVIMTKASLDPAAASDPAAALEGAEWLALGFEIVDCPFLDWKFQPADFVASFGLHAALIVGEPMRIEPSMIPTLVEALPRLKLTLRKDGQAVAEGSGKNSLRSPALCLGELAAAIARQPGMEPLGPGEVVSSGSLTEAQPIAPGQVWTATVEGIDLPGLTLQT